MSETEQGVFVGRLNPIHLGHERVIDHMIEACGIENSTVIIGSANQPMSMRHFFSYSERSGLVKTLYPGIRVAGLPDFPGNDGDWLVALDDLLALNGSDVDDTRFFGGCDEDVHFFKQATPERKIAIVNRFDGTTPKISATEVRDSLLHGRSLEGLLNPTIEEFVVGLFWKRWESFKNT